MNSPQFSIKKGFPQLLQLGFFLLFLLFFSFVGEAQNDLLSQKISLKVKEKTFAEALELIEKKADCKFSYSNNFLPTKTYSFSYRKTSVQRILDRLFAGTNLTYTVEGSRIILSLEESKNLTETPIEKKRNVTLSGYLRDAETGESLISGTVYIYDLEVGVYTNEYGFFSLTVPQGNYDIEFSYLGYENKKANFQLSNNKWINTELDLLENDLIEVVVTEKKKESSVDLHRQQEQTNLNQVKKLPTLLGEIDVIRSLEFLPGVQVSGDGSGGFSVRGGSTDQNLILLDEAPVHYPSHLYGIFSIFNPDAIQSVRLLRNNIPTKYRGRLASVMDVRMKEGNNKKFGASGGIGLLMAQLKFEGQLFKERSSFMVAGRRSYFDWIIRPFSNSDQRSFIYDLNTKFNFKISKKDHLYFSAYIGRDVFETDENFSLIWGNNTFTTRWNHIFNNRLFANTSLIISDFDYKSSTSLFGLIGGDPGNPSVPNFQLQTKINDINLKSTFELYQNPSLNIRFGGNLIYHSFLPANLIDKVTEEEVSGSTPRDAWENSIFGAVEWDITDKWHLEGGLHLSSLSVVGTGNFIYDYDEVGNRIDSTFYEMSEVITNYFGAEPRLSITRKIKQNAEANFSYNHTVQYLHLLPSSFVNNPASAWLPSTKIIKPQRAHQLNLGYYRSLWKEKFRFSVDAYYIYRWNQIAYRDGANIEFGADLEGQLTSGKSWSYGVEFMLQKEVGKLKGLVSYALSTTRDQFRELNDGAVFRSVQDRPQSFALMLVWSPSPRFTISGSWTYASGKIATVPIGKYQVNNQIINFYGDRNNYRMSDHHRADISLQWFRTLKNGLKHNWSFSIYNIYFHHNPEFLYIDQFGSQAQEVSFFTVAILRCGMRLSFEEKWYICEKNAFQQPTKISPFLTTKKYRDKHQVFTVEGDKIAKEVLQNQTLSVQQIVATENWMAQNHAAYSFDNQMLNVVTEKDLKKISNLKTPNQVYLVVEKPAANFSKEKLQNNYAFFLDNIQDPGNLGTLWRIADWFGIPYVFTSKGCVDWSNSKVIQSSMGAFLRVKIIPMDFTDLKKECPNVLTYATVLGGKNIHEVEFSKNGILMVGNESKGLAANLQEMADVKITIPKGKNGGAESLNAAVATGIVCGLIHQS